MESRDLAHPFKLASVPDAVFIFHVLGFSVHLLQLWIGIIWQLKKDKTINFYISQDQSTGLFPVL